MATQGASGHSLDADRWVWLDSTRPGWSVIGVLTPSDVSLTYSAVRREVTRHVDGRAEVVGRDIWEVLAAELAAGGPGDRWFGYLGYACRPDLPAAASADVPDAVWLRPSQVRVVGGLDTPSLVPGHGLDTPSLVPFDTPRPSATQDQPRDGYSTSEDARWSSRASASEPVSRPPDSYVAGFERVQEELRAGNTYETNLTYRIAVESDLDPLAAYLRLRELNPAPYAGFLQHRVAGASAWLLSSSPERYAAIDADRLLEARPIKGTTARAEAPEQDAVSAERLRNDPKFRSENLMIVDLLRNDLAMVCDPGTVEVPELMAVESYPSVHQLVSTVRGRVRAGVGTVAALRALFPAGSMTGAPKLRTMEIIDAVEAAPGLGGPRGAYAGAFGWIAGDGRADLGVVIRSLTTAGDGRWRLGTGGGITVRSDLVEEWAETRWKAERLLAALAL